MIAVLFEAKAEPAYQARYMQLAAELKPLLADIDGFIDIERL
ncbi:antibiotic biosynthesis monooxygenase, partial [Staphylococcus warneri]